MPTDRHYMERAVEQMKEDPRPHKVGAVLVSGDKVWEAHGAQTWQSFHAEGHVLQMAELASLDLRQATLYTTLEPCITRRHPSRDCAAMIVDRGIGRVVIGLLDPNPKIYGRGTLFLERHGVKVERFPEDLQGAIEQLMGPWLSEQRAKRSYEELFAVLERKLTGSGMPSIAGPTVGTTATIRLCPNISRGWLFSEVPVIRSTERYGWPTQLVEDYTQYFAQYYDDKGFKNDGRKIMLRSRPRSFTDSPSLSLDTIETTYSQVLFTRDRLATDPQTWASLVDAITASPQTRNLHPHSLCLHLIVSTADRKLLLTRRALDVEYYPDTWSCSIEENMAPKDFPELVPPTLLSLGQRALFEELGLGPDSYHPDNLRLLSVFLEADSLNISLCGLVTIALSAFALNRLLRGMPRADYEFTAVDFQDLDENELADEILSGSLAYHPTTQYRFLLSLLHLHGLPRSGAPWVVPER